ncbi:hypothetical protein THER5_0061 [Bifidobacterium thermacidophilum subsp. thermacidophilum]|uniref:Uncharacterized protein n=1 Tax=Bifidobacterium thermacidophilum subsp. thermacidophilum TaxID=79262 RepID=A0A087E277_9BIFI|nr:hypothetical protein THER5_0061 [Bifidobacterium thermacidophilum subsp. thermacidophilum]
MREFTCGNHHIDICVISTILPVGCYIIFAATMTAMMPARLNTVDITVRRTLFVFSFIGAATMNITTPTTSSTIAMPITICPISTTYLSVNHRLTFVVDDIDTITAYEPVHSVFSVTTTHLTDTRSAHGIAQSAIR